MNPYEQLPGYAFWKTAVAQKSMFDVDHLWMPKFRLSQDDRVVTFGSCFAQHIGNALVTRGFNWYAAEPSPPGLSAEDARKRNYNVFSARTGNIYTTSLLRQWTEWALLKKDMPAEAWEGDGRFFDPFRPAIEPGGFSDIDALRRSQSATLASFRNCIEQAKYFVFTLGLTESWINRDGLYEYPACPGTIAGEFDPQQHRFVNQKFEDVRDNLLASLDLMRVVNADLRFILTVSPVPLTATNSGRHVLVATMASKSVLRAVADEVAADRTYVDYFPSYELINSPVFKGIYFEPNQRNVNPRGVDFVMEHFFSCAAESPGPSHRDDSLLSRGKFDPDCEEALLETFNGSRPGPSLDEKQRVVLGNSHLAGFKDALAARRPLLNGIAYVPQYWLKDSIQDLIRINRLTEFTFSEEYEEAIARVRIEHPEILILVGLGLAGDGIIRAFGPLKAGFAGCSGHEISPTVPIITGIDGQVVDFYRRPARIMVNFARQIEDETPYSKIVWIAAPDMPLHAAVFRFGREFVESGTYKLHKRAYMKALLEENAMLRKTHFVFHSEDKCCDRTGFSLDGYRASGNDWDIHCSREYYADTVEHLAELI
ncbi:MAG: GSCFA domain-containing protein [Gammaproteobacteria bacterium]|nr:GSCFA domain-containing protein [Gammaproteobacteria bacterium]